MFTTRFAIKALEEHRMRRGRPGRIGRPLIRQIAASKALLVLVLVIAACGRIDIEATSLEPQTTTAATTADSDASIADSAPISGLRPGAGSYRQRYLSDLAPLIVDCMNDLGWEATYDPRLGALLAEVPPSQEMERDGAMSFCVAGSHNRHEIYAD